jgi:hypothetical protein
MIVGLMILMEMGMAWWKLVRRWVMTVRMSSLSLLVRSFGRREGRARHLHPLVWVVEEGRYGYDEDVWRNETGRAGFISWKFE